MITDVSEGLPASVYNSVRRPVLQDLNIHQYLRFYSVRKQDQVGFHCILARYCNTRDVKACLDMFSVCFTFRAKFTSRRQTDCNFCPSKIAGRPSLGFLLELNWMSNRQKLIYILNRGNVIMFSWRVGKIAKSVY